MRRALVPLAVITALAVSVPAEAAKPKPKPKPKPAVVVIPACPSFTDPKGDDAAPVGGQGDDPALDLTGVKMSVSGGKLTMAISTAGMGQSMRSEGAEYDAGFSAGGKAIELFGTRTTSRPAASQAFALQGITVDGTYVKGTSSQVTEVDDTAHATVTLTVSMSDLAAAAGTKLTGTVGGLDATVRATYVAARVAWDTGSGTAKLPLDGCAG